MDYNVSLNKEKRGILCGMLLGDAGKTHNNIFIGHSQKHKEYALFKKELLEKITGKNVTMREFTTKQGYKVIRVEPKQIPEIKYLVKKFYPNGEKKITRQVLDYLTLQGIAIWYMDDGSKSFKKRNGEIHAVEVTLNTYLPKEDNEAIIKYFKEVWGIKWGLNKSKDKYRLRMGTKQARKFFQLIEPFIIEPMKYKIALSSCKFQPFNLLTESA